MRKRFVVRLALTGLLLLLPMAGSAAGGSLLDDAAKLDWDARDAGALHKLFPDTGAVEAFLKEADPDFQIHDGPFVGDYAFVDIGAGGGLVLMATTGGTGGRKIYNSTSIVRKVNSRLQVSAIHSPGISIRDLRSRIIDLNGDGTKEFLAPRLLAVPRSYADPRPIINDAYAWNGTRFSKASSSFKEYYRAVLQQLQYEHDAIVRGQLKVAPLRKPLFEEKYTREIEAVEKILSR
jgi:hypothetical protein